MLIGTDYKFLIFPKRCRITKKLLCLTHAYVEIHCYTGPGDSIFEYKYFEKQNYLIHKLKGTL